MCRGVLIKVRTSVGRFAVHFVEKRNRRLRNSSDNSESDRLVTELGPSRSAIVTEVPPTPGATGSLVTSVSSVDARGGRSAGVRFAVRFALISGLLFALYGFPYRKYGISEQWLGAYLSGYAEVVGALLRLVEDNVVVQGNTVYGAAALRIVRTCDAMEANVLFSSAVIAFPGPAARKVVVLAGGLLSIAGINLFRIVTLYYAVLEHEPAFAFLHLELWPLLLIVATVALFLASIRLLGAPQPAAEAPPTTRAT